MRQWCCSILLMVACIGRTATGTVYRGKFFSAREDLMAALSLFLA